MARMIAELYNALRAAGVADDKAEAAAVAEAPDVTQLATKADLKDIENRLQRWFIGVLLAQVATLIAVVLRG
jgi:hypothetical protein